MTVQKQFMLKVCNVIYDFVHGAWMLHDTLFLRNYFRIKCFKMNLLLVLPLF